MDLIYLDHNSTTPLDQRVLDDMTPFLTSEFGNPSSMSHAYGWRSGHAVKQAREQIAECLSCEPKEVFWTSGATESNNMVLWGTFFKNRNEPAHYITAATEHKAVIDVVKELEQWGAQTTILPVDKEGFINLSELENSISQTTRLVSIMFANNEIGTIQDIKAIAQICKDKGVLFHCDAAQAFGKIPIDLRELPIDFLSISGHKVYGPKGVGALFIRGGKEQQLIHPLFQGGEQEGRIRPGTLNVPGIIGLGSAGALALAELDAETSRLKGFQKTLRDRVLSAGPEVHFNGPVDNRLINNLSFSFEGLSADIFALGLSGLALSSGSACSSGSGLVSHVLKAIGHPDELARATLRIGLGRTTTPEQIQTAGDKITRMLEKNLKLAN